MKNIQLISVLLPTEDASILSVLKENNQLHYHEITYWHKNNFTNQHLYLVSDAAIKEGDWVMSHPDTHTQKDAEEKLFSQFGKAEIITEQGIKLVEPDGHWYWTNLDCKKIIFTTDPKLIADGVPAIDGNTKANTKMGFSETNPNDSSLWLWKEINFLEEFCKMYNQKNNQKEDLQKFGLSYWSRDLLQDELDKVDSLNPREYEKVISIIEETEVYYQKQALQSQAGCFSLEDMRKIFKAGEDRGIGLGMNDNAEYIKPDFEEFIQSLKQQSKGDIDTGLNVVLDNKKENDYKIFPQPKGDIVIEYNEETKTLTFK